MRLAIVFVLAVTLIVPIARAQTTGALEGTVTLAGKPLPGAHVTIASPAMQGSRTFDTDLNGRYHFEALPPGDYRVDFAGGELHVSRTVRVAVAQTQELDAAMKVREDLIVAAAPESDVTSAPVSTNMTLPFIERLPVLRNQLATAQLAPGVTANVFNNGQLQISGGPGYDNLVLVDGVVVTENVLGQLRPMYVEDGIEETTTLTGAIPVEYGRFTGGVVSTISKWGGNALHGSLRDNLSNPVWSAATPANESRPDTLNHVWEGTVGGSVVPDRLWFFGSGRWAKNDTARQTVAVPAFGTATAASPLVSYLEGNDQKRYEAKLTAQVDPRDSLSATFFRITTDGTNARFNANFYDLASLSARSIPESLGALHYNGVITPSFNLEAQASRRTFTQTSGATTSDLVSGTVLLDRANSNTRFNSPSLCALCGGDHRDNDDARLKTSYSLATPRFGSHDLVAGADRFEERRTPANDQSGSGFLVFATRAQYSNGVIYPVFTPSTPNGGGTFIRWSPVTTGGVDDHLRTTSFFASDEWTAGTRWSGSVGARYDRDHAENADGSGVARDARVTPRLALQFDPRGDGWGRFTASYAEYASKFADNIASNGQIAGSAATIDYAYRGPGINVSQLNTPMAAAIAALFNYFNSQQGGTANTAANNLRVNGQRVVPGYSAYFDGSLRMPYVRELTLGYGSSLARHGYMRLDLIRRDWHDLYSASVTPSTERTKTPLGLPVDLLLITNSNQVTRQYRAAQFQARWNPRPFDAGVFYTYSKLRGNDDGETAAGAGPALDPSRYYAEVMNYSQFAPMGYLSGDQRHRLRMWGGWTFGRMSASLLQTYDSGLPYSAVGQIARPQTAPYNAVPAGTYFFSGRGAYRTDNISSTNLALRWSQPLVRGLDLFVQGDLLNALNRHGIADSTKVSTSVTTAATSTALKTFDPFHDTPAAGTNYALAANFGQALNEQAYQTPRTVRFSMGVRF
jgi:Carboxypeptidase regulatory-like domain